MAIRRIFEQIFFFNAVIANNLRMEECESHQQGCKISRIVQAVYMDG